MTALDFTETQALKMALDVAARKSGRHPAWLHGALQPRQPARTEPEAAGLSGQALIAALHGGEDVRPDGRLSGTPGEADEASGDEAA